ncbi:MAG: right-handed parallel beta-helix repeat-containing protein [Lentisphaeraceae bacterium]|nr:right-handed parallel beta-helix repeat-containing protein [Lentisphaeraceae bacterium]
MKFLLLFFLSATVFSQQKFMPVYVNHESGNDANIPCSEQKPLKTFTKAMSVLKESGTMYIQKTSKPYKKSLHVTVGGSEVETLKIIADNAVIDLSTDISSGPWIKEDQSYILDKPIKRKYKDSQRAVLFVDSIPVHPYSKNLKEKYHVTCLEDGRLKILFPSGINPVKNKHKIILNSPAFSNAVSFGNNASNITIEGLTVKHSGNDGFNLHGSSKNIILKNITTAYNGDEGISAHEDIDLKVFNSIIAFNGSSAGGIADINQSTSYYSNCLIINNYANAFYFSGKEHSVENCLIWGNRRKLHYGKTTILNEKNIYKFKNEQDALSQIKTLPESLQKLLRSYSHIKFRLLNQTD